MRAREATPTASRTYHQKIIKLKYLWLEYPWLSVVVAYFNLLVSSFHRPFTSIYFHEDFLQRKDSFCCFLLRIWAGQSAAMLVHTFPIKSRKRLACDVLDTFANTFRLCSWRNWYRQLVTKQQHSQSSIRDYQTSIFNRQDQKSSENLLCVLICFYCIPVYR